MTTNNWHVPLDKFSDEQRNNCAINPQFTNAELKLAITGME